MLYSLLIAAVCGIMGYALLMRSTSEISVIEDRNPLFVTLSDGSVRNGYTLKILNKAHEPRRFSVAIEGVPEPHVAVVGFDRGEAALSVEPDGVRAFKVYVTVPAAAKAKLAAGSAPLEFVVTEAGTGERVVRKTTFRSAVP